MRDAAVARGGGALHQIFFGVKRMHWTAIKFTTRTLRTYGFKLLTPARFDMMRILYLRDTGFGVSQDTIRLLLGVSAPTVSRMLRSLEDLGLLIRDRMIHDARYGLIRITAEGRTELRAMTEELIESGELDSTLLGILEGRDDLIDDFDRSLILFRDAFADASPFPNPWFTGDIYAKCPKRLFTDLPPPFYVSPAHAYPLPEAILAFLS